MAHNSFTILGKVTKIDGLVTKSNAEPMMRLTISDGSQEIEILAFGPLVQRNDHMEVGDKVWLTGKINVRKTRATYSSKEYKNMVLIASEIEVMQAKKHINKKELTLDTPQEEDWRYFGDED